MTERQPTGSFAADLSAHLSTSRESGHTRTANPAVPQAEDPLPRSFGRYELRRLLGTGGMGRVYLAHDPHLDRLVALKMPNPVEGVAAWRERFQAEARAAATLTHPNVCPVYDVGEVEGQPFLTMGFIEGETLATKLQREGVLALDEAVDLVRTVARAMQEAHRRGIIHRDLKPANLMLDPAGRPVIMDFGLAIRATSADDLRLTLTGVALGTPAYMPPEQASGEHDAIGPASDVYSLGVILYELVTGRVPFKGKSFGKLLAQIERDPPPSPSSLNPEVEEALQSVILTALAKSPTDRFADAGTLADALDSYQEGDHHALISLYSKPYQIPEPTGEYQPASRALRVPTVPRSRRRFWLAGAAALLLAATTGVVIYVQTDYGQLVVHLSDPTAKVDVKVNGQEVTLTPDGGTTVRVRAGKDNTVEVRGEGFETISKSYTLTRGETRVATITLQPKGGVPGVEVPPGGGVDVVPGTPGNAGPPKPVKYPEKSALIEIPGWQILTDASRADLDRWLAEHKREGHSVGWLAVTGVEGKPVYAASAALDDRQPDWIALPDFSADEFGTRHIYDLVDFKKYRPIVMTGYAPQRECRMAMLWLPGRSANGFFVPDFAETAAREAVNREQAEGSQVQSFSPYPFGEGALKYAVMTDDRLPERGVRLEWKVAAADMPAFLERLRRESRRPTGIVGYPKDGEFVYGVVSAENPEKLAWEVTLGAPAGGLQQRAAELGARRFRPASVYACPWDGAVRYCAVWVKEPPKAVKYPPKLTLVEIPGWQILTDATKGQMQAWLDERKKAKHSVMWLDAYQVEGKPVFCAVAALDDRQTDWVAMLDVSGEDVAFPDKLAKHIDAKKYRPISLSGYWEGIEPKSVVLWHAGSTLWGISPANTPTFIAKQIEQMAEKGVHARLLRMYALGAQGSVYAYSAELSNGKGSHTLDVVPAELQTFLDAERTKNNYPISLSAGLKDGLPAFTAVTAPAPNGWEWRTDLGLTPAQLQAKATNLARTGFRPGSLTAYPWDGAVRYCVVWVKEPPKQVEFPKAKTLIEIPGWQILTDATKDDMQTWLDERKKANHSVMWLDAYQVGDKPVFCAVAALDDRAAKWTVMLDKSADDVNSVPQLGKAIDVTFHHVISISGYTQGDGIKVAILWHQGPVRWAISANEAEGGLDEVVRTLAGKGFTLRLLRPHPVGENRPRQAFYVESRVRGSATYKTGLTADQMTQFLKEQRDNGSRAHCLAAAVLDGMVQFTAVCEPDKDKWEWQTDTGLTAADLKAKAAALADKGFRPSSVTAYPFDGAVRYCVVWVKQPPKPVPFPKEKTLIEIPGWQILTDATKDQMQTWLDEHKKAKHSVMWLDACTVDGKVAYSAVAATDSRMVDWMAVLAAPAEDFTGAEGQKRWVDDNIYRPVSTAGFVQDGETRLAFLGERGGGGWAVRGGIPAAVLPEFVKTITDKGMEPRQFRASTGINGAVTYTLGIGLGSTRKTAHETGLSPEALGQSLQAAREAGRHPLVISAYQSEGALQFAMVTAANTAKSDWDVTHDLTTTAFQAEAIQQGKQGFHPESVTAYTWDGAVRYCIVWVKEPAAKVQPVPVAPKPRPKP